MTTFATPPDIGVSSIPTDTSSVGWQRRYAHRLLATDLVVVCLAVFGAALPARLLREHLDGPGWLDLVGDDGVSYLAVCLLTIALWSAVLAATGSRSNRAVGVGSAEFKAIGQSTLTVLVAFALMSIAFQIDFSRAFTLTMLIGAATGLLGTRLLWRLWLNGQRRGGAYVSRSLIVGSTGSATQIATDLRKHPGGGYHVVGAVLSDAGASAKSSTASRSTAASIGC